MASIIKVDNVQNTPGTNIIDKCGTTITLGQSGDTVSLASGASQTGFGRTGTVDWVTTIQTSTPFTAVSGKGYFINTTSGAITMNLPASPSVGDIVSVKDYAFKFGTNAVTVGRNSSNIDGGASNGILATDGLSVTYIYMDASKGWSFIREDTTNKAGQLFVAASVSGSCNTLATAPDCGDYKVATFKNPGTFTVTCAGNGAGSNTVEAMIVAGGGGGGRGCSHGSGGGAGGYRTLTCESVSATGYAVVVGSGGAGSPGSPKSGVQGGTSSIFCTASAGGGGGGGWNNTGGNAGGSGGGSACNSSPGNVGAGNTPNVTPPQGNPGGPAAPCRMGGGGGAGATGTGGPSGGTGGVGLPNDISGSGTFYAGGGGAGGSNPAARAAGGNGGGGCGGGPSPPDRPGVAGTAFTGGGGGGSYNTENGGNGGSGLVIIRYKFQ